jgi:hypothetical protein
LVSTKSALRRSSFGSTGAVSVRKLIKQTNAFSWPSCKHDVDQLRPSKAKSNVWATGTGVLGKTNAAVGQKVTLAPWRLVPGMECSSKTAKIHYIDGAPTQLPDASWATTRAAPGLTNFESDHRQLARRSLERKSMFWRLPRAYCDLMQKALYQQEGRVYHPVTLLQWEDVTAVVVQALMLPATAK